ncbi:GNAT family N-acetyltransferase [Isoptericola hypogeus]|uniref:GNAT family N-acetyltransferase n=1 Tax=Isoptericola hypogeus TaxID=300179 RepID=A0ABN2J6M1_9MICO
MATAHDVSVRRATTSDVDALLPLFLGYLAFYDAEHPPESARGFLAERVESGDGIVFVAESGGRALGLAQVYPTFSSLGLQRVWTLNDLFVDPEARGAGTGRALVRAVVAAAREAGARSVQLSTAWDNVEAQALYEAEGLVREREFVTYSLSLA